MKKNKSWISNKTFRRIQAQLDKIGICTEISFNGKLYGTYFNYSFVKVYKTRESCRRYIVRLFNEKFPSDAIKPKKK